MNKFQSHKELLVWQKGISLVKKIYLLCEEMPKNEVFGLQNQLKRAAVSIPSNIAEGFGRSSNKSFAQFLKVARGSLLEIETQIIIAKELEFISEEDFDNINLIIEEEHKMLNSFIRSIESNYINQN